MFESAETFRSPSSVIDGIRVPLQRNPSIVEIVDLIVFLETVSDQRVCFISERSGALIKSAKKLFC